MLTELRHEAALYVVQRMRAGDRAEINAMRFGDDDESLAEDIALRWGAWSFCAWHEGLPVAIFGARELWPGVWSAWMIATDDFPKVALGLTKFVRRVIMPHLIKMGAHRVEAISMDGHTEAHRWLRAIGSVQEARLRRYGRNGEDYLVFRWDPDVQG